MKKSVKAVYDDDLIDFLKSIGEYNRILKKQVTCKFCNTTITLNNIIQIFPESGSVKYICDRPECIVQLSEYRK